MGNPRFGRPSFNNFFYPGTSITAVQEEIDAPVENLRNDSPSLRYESPHKSWLTDSLNNFIRFKVFGVGGDPGAQLKATVPDGRRFQGAHCFAVAKAMNDAIITAGGTSTNANFTVTWTVDDGFTIDRPAGTFDLYTATGGTDGTQEFSAFQSLGMNCSDESIYAGITSATSTYHIVTTGGSFGIGNTTHYKLKFKQGATTYNVTIPGTGYTALSLCTAMKEAMDDATGVQDNDWTMTQDNYATWKFRYIGGTATDLIVVFTDPDSIYTVIGFDTTTTYSGVTDQLAEVGKFHYYETIAVQEGQIAALTDFLLTGSNLSDGADIHIFASTDGVTVGAALGSTIFYKRDQDGLGNFLDRGNAVAFYDPAEDHDWFIIRIGDSKNPDGFISIGTIFLGETFELSGQRAWEYRDGGYAITLKSESEGGAISGSILFSGDAVSSHIPQCNDTDRLNLRALRMEVEDIAPFYLCFDNEAANPNAWTMWAIFTVRPETPRLPLPSAATFTTDFSVRDAA